MSIEIKETVKCVPLGLMKDLKDGQVGIIRDPKSSNNGHLIVKDAWSDCVQVLGKPDWYNLLLMNTVPIEILQPGDVVTFEVK